MKLNATNIEGLFTHNPEVHEDSRGYFFEAFRRDQIREAIGIDFQAVQWNTSVSKRGVVRGVHFMQVPPGQAKFVSVSKGAIIDVVIDLRPNSSDFGSWQAFELNETNRRALLIGHGLGHSFLSLEDGTTVQYLCDSYYSPELEHAIHPMQAGIDWRNLGEAEGISEFSVSLRDSGAPALSRDLAFLPH